MSFAAAGPHPTAAAAVVVLVHGRGASADDMLGVARLFRRPDVAYLAPQAPANAWYPYSFLAPLEQNEPHLSRALETLQGIVDDLMGGGVPVGRIVLGGFSQGACLAAEFAARRARRYGGLFALSGGLIGPDGTPRDYDGAFDGMPAFLGCSDVDPHIPVERVYETARVLERMGAHVDARIYPGMPHSVNEDEVRAVRAMLDTVSPRPALSG